MTLKLKPGTKAIIGYDAKGNEITETIEHPGSKYRNEPSYSELCGRKFDSKGERRRGELLHLLEQSGNISNLEYQPKFILCESDPVTHKPVTYTADFRYIDMNGNTVIEDYKGCLTRESRVKIAWLWEKFEIKVQVIK